MVEWGRGSGGVGNMINQTHFTLTTSASRNGKSGEGGETKSIGKPQCVCAERCSTWAWSRLN